MTREATQAEERRSWRMSLRAPGCCGGLWPPCTARWSGYSVWRSASGRTICLTAATAKYGWNCEGRAPVWKPPRWGPALVYNALSVQNRDKLLGSVAHKHDGSWLCQRLLTAVTSGQVQFHLSVILTGNWNWTRVHISGANFSLSSVTPLILSFSLKSCHSSERKQARIPFMGSFSSYVVIISW